MKTRPTAVKNPLLRGVVIASFAFALAACGGGGSDDPVEPDNPDGIDANNDGVIDSLDDVNGDGVVDADDIAAHQASLEPLNPDNLDVNGDGFIDAEDDFNGDGFVDQTDVDEFNAAQAPQGPDCVTFDCTSEDSIWTNNAHVSRIQNSNSTYALGIQRIMYCLNYGGTAEADTLAGFADGVYGPLSAASVELYQSDNPPLVVDGVVGPETWDALQSELALIPGSNDGVYEYYEIPSGRTDCTGQAMFAQEIDLPRGWRLTSVPGSNQTIPFWVCDSTAATCP